MATRNPERTAKIVAMFTQGITLQKIGEHFGVTRERIRQILDSVGVPAEQGGRYKVAESKRARKQQQAEAKSIAEHGFPIDVMRTFRRCGLTRAYQNQRKSAALRGIGWRLSFAQWYAVWEASGKLSERGRGRGKYCMSRINDAGGYEYGNVHIQLATENSSDATKKWIGNTKKHRGVFDLYPGRELRYLAMAGKKRLGFFSTAEEAAAARAEYLRANPLKRTKPPVGNRLGSGKGYQLIENAKKPYKVVAGQKYIGLFATEAEAVAAYQAACASRIAMNAGA